jgi:hypothetical protein
MQRAYLRGMAYFPRPARPKALLADFKAMFAANRRHKLIFGAMAIGMTSLIVTGFILEARNGILPGASTIYVSDWSATRTDAEIVKQQKIDQKDVEAYKAERRRQFKKVDEAMTRWGF